MNIAGSELITVFVVLLVQKLFFMTIGLAGTSMYPTFEGSPAQTLISPLAGDRFFITRYQTWLYSRPERIYQRGDIVLFIENADSPCRFGRRALLVKRLIGLPGDHIVIDEEGNVTINNVTLDQSFITESPDGRVGPNTRLTDVVVPGGQYFVLGDNRVNSCDSRIYGMIPTRSMLGEATAVIWPPMRSGAMNWRGLRPPEAFSTIPNP